MVTGYGKTLRIRYKPRSGGMAETTLNSTITELFPAIAWEKSIPSNLSVTDFAHQIHEASVTVGPTSPYKNNVAKLAGDRFKNIASTSSKFEEKTSAAIGIYKWILNEAKRRTIRGIVWGYRDNTKPAGVNTNHKGDIFILWGGRQKPRITGVSIKAGAVGAKPPQFNSYVRAIFNSNAFGKLADYPRLKGLSKKFKQITVVQRKVTDKGPSFGEQFHTDSIYTKKPPRFTMLYSKLVPKKGRANTEFSSQYLAYDYLPKSIKNKLLKVKGRYSSEGPISVTTRERVKEKGRKIEELKSIHKIIKKINSKNTIYCSPGHLVGFSPNLKNSEKVKKQLFKHQVKKKFQYSLEWEKDQLAIWDNRSMLHQATPFKGNRIMHRITIL